jgi:hypothetical protein
MSTTITRPYTPSIVITKCDSCGTTTEEEYKWGWITFQHEARCDVGGAEGYRRKIDCRKSLERLARAFVTGTLVVKT